jgi:hypothetical protein
MVSRLIKAFIFLFLFAYSYESISQSLAFSQVLTFEGTINANNPVSELSVYTSDGPAYTVPEGKVWKIESFTFFQPGNYPAYMTFKLNSTFIKCTRQGQSTGFVPGVTLPFWLKPGDTIKACYVEESTPPNFYGGSYPFAISIIELTAP